MRGKRRIFGLAALLFVLLAVPLASSLGIIDFPKFTSGILSTTSVFVNPAAISNSALQSGSTFTVHVNVTGITDLFTWQINMSWDPSILNMKNIIAGAFLASPRDTSSEALGWVINKTDNAIGYSAPAETILGNVTGITGNGRLVTIEFLVVGYGSTDLIISVSGTLPTTLLDSDGVTIIPDDITNGYFRNKYPGDIDGNWVVDYDDFLAFLATYLKTSAQPGYNREADFNLSGVVDYDDFLVFLANYLKTFPH